MWLCGGCLYSRPGFVDVTDEPGHHSRDQRAATRPGCGPGTRHGFCPVGLVNTRLGTERPKNAHTLTASTSDREGFVCVECPGSPSSSSAPAPHHHHPVSPRAQMASTTGMKSGCSQRLGAGGFSISITFNLTLEHSEALKSL